MTRPIFHWHDDAHLFVQGVPIGLGGHNCGLARDMGVLRDLVRAGTPFTVGPTGVNAANAEATGYFSTQSGGTTGSAKTIRRTQASWIASFHVNRDVLGLSAADNYGVLGMPAHSLALYASIEAAHIGADLHVFAGQSPRQQAHGLAKAAATVLYATPTQLRLLCDAGVSLPSLRHILCGGGHLAPQLRANLETLCPNSALREFYGASETSFIAWGDGTGPKGAVGTPYPGVELKIEPSDSNHGEIWIRSPYLFEEYTDGSSPETRWCDGFVAVGEIGQIDAQGYLTVIGRRNRMVTIADQNVFPEDIEACLLEDPDVTHCAVIPRADARRGAVLVAVIATALSSPEGLKDRLLGQCRARFGPLAAPRTLFVLHDFPLTLSGKPDLGAIRSRLEIAQ